MVVLFFTFKINVMIVIAFEVDDKKCYRCYNYKFTNTFERIGDVIFTRGDDVTFENCCSELEDYIIHSQDCDNDDLELFGSDLKGKVIKSIALTKNGCVRFGLKRKTTERQAKEKLCSFL
jgi:hypothetical protein